MKQKENLFYMGMSRDILHGYQWQMKTLSPRSQIGRPYHFWFLLFSIVLTFHFAFLQVAFSYPSSSSPQETLTIGMSQEFENLNPLIMTMSATTYIYAMVGRPLVTLDAQGRWIPVLATEIPSLQNQRAQLSSDKRKLTVRWTLREDAQWNDGTPITCADIAFTHEVALNPNISIAERESYSHIEKITWDPKKPKDCTFHYKKARWDFNQLGSFRPLPKHLEEPVFKAHKDQPEGYEKNTLYVKNPTTRGLYNGPYQIKEVKLGSHVIVEPNPYFYGKTRPHFHRIILKIIPNTGTMDANLRSGAIDMVSSLGIAFDQALQFQKKVTQENLPYQVLFKPSLTYEHIDLNLHHPILQDIRVRRALIHSIHREELVQALFEGQQRVANHLFSPIDPWYTDSPKWITTYPYSLEQAHKLLDEAGWKMEKDGYRYKNGSKLSLVLMTTAGNKTREMVQTYLQNQWKKVGIEVQIKNEPARVLFSETAKKRQFPMMMYAWVSAPESSPRSQLHCSSIPSEKNGWSGQNFTGFCDPKMDNLLEQLEEEFNPEKRKKLAYQITKIYTEQAFVIPLYYRSDIAIIPKALKGFELTGHMFAESHFVENWRR